MDDFRVLTSVIHYIACDGGKFEICNYDVDLEKKRKEAKCFFEFYFDYFYTDGKKKGGRGGTDDLLTNLGK